MKTITKTIMFLFITMAFATTVLAKPIHISLEEVKLSSKTEVFEIRYELVFQVYDLNSGYIEYQELPITTILNTSNHEAENKNILINDNDMKKIKLNLGENYPKGTKFILYRLNTVMFQIGDINPVAFGSIHFDNEILNNGQIVSGTEDKSYFKIKVY